MGGLGLKHGSSANRASGLENQISNDDFCQLCCSQEQGRSPTGGVTGH